jgi:hypothetical protein
MSLSVDTRKDNLAYALRLLMEMVGDKWIESTLLVPGNPELNAVLPTTWSELESKVYVRTRLRYYTMTPHGWLTGMKLLGKKTDVQFAEQVGRIAAALKDSVKGRTREAFLFTDAVAKEGEVAKGLVCNVVDSKLFERWHQRKGADWESFRSRGQVIRVPTTFGLELI